MNCFKGIDIDVISEYVRSVSGMIWNKVLSFFCEVFPRNKIWKEGVLSDSHLQEHDS